MIGASKKMKINLKLDAFGVYWGEIETSNRIANIEIDISPEQLKILKHALWHDNMFYIDIDAMDNEKK